MLAAMLPVIIFLVIVLVVVFVVNKSSSDALKRLAAGLNGRILRNGKWVFSRRGQDVFAQYTPAGKNTPPQLRLYTKGSFGAQLLIRPETGLDKFFKGAGLNRELEVADREMNDRLYFECDDQEFLNHFLMQNDIKSQVFKLLGRYSDIEITPQSCLLKRNPSPGIEAISQNDMEQMADDLLDVAAQIPAYGGSHPELVLFKIKGVVLKAVGVLTLIAGIVFLVWSAQYPLVNGARIWNYTFCYALPVLAAVVALVYISIRGFSTSSKVFVLFLWTFGLGVVLISRFGTAVYNGFYDQSSTQAYDREVVEKYTTYHKGSTYYHVIIAPWRSDQPNWSFQVQSDEYDRISPSTTKYRVFTHQGCLNFEWVAGQQELR